MTGREKERGNIIPPLNETNLANFRKLSGMGTGLFSCNAMILAWCRPIPTPHIYDLTGTGRSTVARLFGGCLWVAEWGSLFPRHQATPSSGARGVVFPQVLRGFHVWISAAGPRYYTARSHHFRWYSRFDLVGLDSAGEELRESNSASFHVPILVRRTVSSIQG